MNRQTISPTAPSLKPRRSPQGEGQFSPTGPVGVVIPGRFCACSRPAVIIKYHEPICAECLAMEDINWHKHIDQREMVYDEVFKIHCIGV